MKTKRKVSGLKIELQRLDTAFRGDYCYTHARAGITPQGFAVITMQPLRLSGSDIFYGMRMFKSSDGGKSWSDIEACRNLVRLPWGRQEGCEHVFCDGTPFYHRASGKMIGTCGFTSFDDDNNAGEIGYVLNPAYRGQGLMPEAALEVMKFGFLRLNLHRITARYMEGNAASRRVMDKIGMSFEGTFRRAVYIKGDYRTVSACAILREEFLSMREQVSLEKRQPFLKS